MNKTASDLLIGDLIRGAGLVTLPDLTNAVQVASKTGLPVGRVLVMLGLISSEVVQAALQAQSLIRDNAISMDAGKKAICLVSASRISLDDALRHLGMAGYAEPTNKLGALLLGAELISQAQLADALNLSQHLGLPLGRILVLRSMLGEEQVLASLEAQVLLRDGKIDRGQAQTALQQMRHCQFDLRATLEQMGIDVAVKRNTIRLGELLMLADLVSETDLMTSIEIGLMENVQIGQMLIDFGFINDETLEVALKLQTMVSNNHLTPGQAGEALRLISRCRLTLVQAIADVIEPNLQVEEIVGLLDLLQLSGVISSEEHERLVMFKDTSIFETVLVETGLMSETTLEVSICCHILMIEGLLTAEQAVVALHHWRWTGVDLAEIFHTMGWSKVNEPQLVPGIYKWESEPNVHPAGTAIETRYQSASRALGLTESLVDADPGLGSSLNPGVTTSLSNYEWGSPITQTLH